MPVFDPPSHEVTAKPSVPEVVKPYYRSNVVDTQYKNRESLLRNVEGSPWKVNFYFQAVGHEDSIQGLQDTRNAARQQYIEVKDLIIRVINDISTDQDNQAKFLNVQGSAYVTSHVIPNKGDHFVADIGDGREGIFQVLESERMSHLKDTVHRIDYRLSEYVQPGFDYQMDWKVIKTYYFYDDPMRYGHDPIVEEGEFNRLRDYDKIYRDKLRSYLSTFWSNEFHTLLVPGTPEVTIYDHFMTTFITKLYSIHDEPLYNNLRILNVTDDYNVMSCNTVLDAILKRDESILRTGIKKVGVASTRLFKFHPIFNSITYTGIRYIVYPVDGTKKIDYQVVGDQTKPADVFNHGNTALRMDELSDIFGSSIILPGFPKEGVPLIKPIMGDDYYIFSEAFYKGHAGLSALEYQVLSFIKGQAPDYRIIDALIQQSQYWSVLETYYYTPILLMLVYAYSRAI